jgi:hypothetical protein
MKKLLLLMILLLIPVVSAESFSARLVTNEPFIKHGEEAYFKVEVKNELNVQQSFSIRFPNSDWTIFLDPLSDYSFSLQPKSSKMINVYVSPRLSFMTGSYAVPMVIRTSEDQKQLSLPIYLYQEETQKEYVPIVNHEILMPYEHDPRNNIQLSINLDNLNNRNITELNIEIKSKLFEDIRIIQLPPLGKRTEHFSFNINKLTNPQNDVVEVKVWSDYANKTYSWTKTFSYKIISYNELIEEKEISKSFLKSELIIKLKNKANIEKNYEIPLEMSNFKRLFSSFEPSYSYKISSSEGKSLIWNIEFEPEEEIIIYVKTSYRILAILILIIILAIIIYFILRPPIKVKKEVSHVGTSEGGISDIKIILFIKNRTGKTIEDISVIEKIPHLASIGKEFQVGTLMPTKVMQNPKKGTLVRWDLQTLEPYEERIITYKLKSKLSILGGLTLPSTIVKYSVRGKEAKIISNRLTLEI